MYNLSVHPSIYCLSLSPCISNISLPLYIYCLSLSLSPSISTVSLSLPLYIYCLSLSLPVYLLSLSPLSPCISIVSLPPCRQLSSDQVMLQQTLQKESKVNKRLSMENEELLWKLHNGDLASPRRLSPTSPFASPRNSASFAAPPLSPR